MPHFRLLNKRSDASHTPSSARKVPTVPERDDADRGFGLIDIVCSISLIGIVVIPMINATFTAIAASSTARQVAEIETVLQNAADRVNRAPVDCDYTIYVEAAAQSKDWDPSRTTATYQYYVPGASATVNGTWAPGGCLNNVRTAGLVQLVTITIVNDTGAITRTINVVKSDV
jgi:hypothetical protein